MQVAVLADHQLDAARRRRRCSGRTATASSTCSIATTGEFLSATPFVKVNWASGLDDEGPADPDAAARRAADVAGHPGRHQLVLAVVQPAHRALLSSRRGRATRRSSGRRRSQYVPGRNFLGGGATAATPAPGAPGVRIGRATPINNWTDAVGQRRRDRDRSADGQKKWTFQQYDVTDSGILTTATRSALYRRARGILLRARRADRAPSCGRRASAARSSTARSPTRWTASSTSR